jgi:hypothetical protein
MCTRCGKFADSFQLWCGQRRRSKLVVSQLRTREPGGIDCTQPSHKAHARKLTGQRAIRRPRHFVFIVS